MNSCAHENNCPDDKTPETPSGPAADAPQPAQSRARLEVTWHAGPPQKVAILDASERKAAKDLPQFVVPTPLSPVPQSDAQKLTRL
jgi:hypothetical protein